MIILVGSQKGLCGVFNSALFKFFEKNLKKLTIDHHVIGVGHFAIEYLKRRKINQIASYDHLTEKQFVQIAQALARQIVDSPICYETVTVYSNTEKTFFVQQPEKHQVLPVKPPSIMYPQEESFLFEQSPELLRDTLRSLLISISLQERLFESLLSEQAARFVSMDGSTRNADTLISSMKLGYNKIRQAAITRELTELSSSL